MSDNRTRIWFALFVLAVFGVGLASGVLMGRRMGPPPPRADGGAGMRGPAGAPLPPPGRLIERLDRDLQLTGDQRQRIEAILEARRPRIEAVQKEVVARAEQEQREMQAEIRTVLTPEQQERFDRWLAQRGRGGRGRMGPMGPGRGGGPY
jgi:Spy/CpxP family protein refolding chaperone